MFVFIDGWEEDVDESSLDELCGGEGGWGRGTGIEVIVEGSVGGEMHVKVRMDVHGRMRLYLVDLGWSDEKDLRKGNAL